MSAPAGSEPGRPRHRVPWRALGLGLGLATLSLLFALWLLRSALVTALAQRALAGRGVVCEDLAIEANALLSELEVAPARCDAASGPVAGVAWDAPLRISLEGVSVSALEAPSLSVVRRPSDDEPEVRGALGSWAQAPARVGAVVRFVSRLSEMESPALRVGRVVVTCLEAGPRPELELSELVAPARSAGTPATLSIAELSLASAAGPLGVSATPRLRRVVVEADTTRGTLEGTVDATVEIPVLGALQLGAIAGERRVRVRAEQLDAAPRWSVELD
ncbi:MAG: hypothetical protein ACK6CU_01095 [Deltaproteobacteria bacterium]